jgi:hypothetical protein
MINNSRVRFVVALCLMTVLPRVAQASAVPAGGSFLVINSIVLGTSVAYGNGMYLVVGARGQGNLLGRFVQNGVPIGTPFLIQTSLNYTHYPRVAFSPDADNGAGAFLVSWSESDLSGGNTSLHVRLVSAAHGGAYGSDVQVSQIPTYWVIGCPVAYSLGSPSGQKKFLVACQAAEGGAFNIEAFFIDNNANVVSGNLIPVQASENHRDPSIAYNPVTDQFVIVHTGYQQPGFTQPPFVAAKFLRADTGQVLVNRLLLYQSTNTFISKVIYLPPTNQYLASWDASGGVYDLLINADWSFGGNVTLVSSRFGTYDSLGLAYNTTTQTTLMVGQDTLSLQDGAVEIGLNGIPLSSGFIATNTTNLSSGGDVFPEVAANPTAPEWVFSFSHDFLSTMAQVVTGSGSAGPPVISQNPTSIVARLGQTVTFTAAATGGPTPTVQWQGQARGASGFTNIAGATSTSYPVFVTPAVVGAQFQAVFTNASGTVTTSAATLTVRPTFDDLDGDGRTDPLLWRPSTGTWYWANTSTSNVNAPAAGIHWGDSSLGDVSLTGDIDGDGVADLVIFRPSNGMWFCLLSSTGYDTTKSFQIMWGGLGDVPILADIDGDEKADIIVWRPSSGAWYWLLSSTGYAYSSYGAIQWGIGTLGDVPLTGDINGDGKADLIIWRPTDGNWYALLSSASGYSYSNQFVRNWGTAGDRPFVGDFDGDHRADFAVWRPSTGWWYWLTSSTGYAWANAMGIQWGMAGDTPMLADFDGDGRSDLAVFRAGVWYWLSSSAGWSYASQASFVFGAAGDLPIVR